MSTYVVIARRLKEAPAKLRIYSRSPEEVNNNTARLHRTTEEGSDAENGSVEWAWGSTGRL